MSNEIIFKLVTYTYWTHQHLIGVLTSRDIKFEQDIIQSEECWSRFKIQASTEIFREVRALMAENTDLSFNIEH